MIRSITVTNYLGDSIKLDLARPELSGFVVKSVTGLGPGKSNINTTESATNDGGVYNSARTPIRNIVLSLGFLWKNTIEDTRQLSYKYFPIKKKVTLLIETDNRKAEIEGYVESNEPNIFSKSEGTDISMICPNPYFYSVGESGTTITKFHNLEPTFEFPFSNESLTEDLLEMGSVNHTYSQLVIYNGDSETGIDIIMNFTDAATNIIVYNLTTHENMSIDTAKLELLTGSAIKEGDEIRICTIKGRKSIHLLRDGNDINILNCLSRNSQWIKLVKGDNVFAYVAERGIDNIQLRIENKVIYEGV